MPKIMNDPWEDVRERTRIDDRRFKESGGHGGHIGAHHDRKALLAAADALLSVVRVSQIELKNGGYTYQIECGICGSKYLPDNEAHYSDCEYASLPEYLR